MSLDMIIKLIEREVELEQQIEELQRDRESYRRSLNQMTERAAKAEVELEKLWDEHCLAKVALKRERMKAEKAEATLDYYREGTKWVTVQPRGQDVHGLHRRGLERLHDCGVASVGSGVAVQPDAAGAVKECRLEYHDNWCVEHGATWGWDQPVCDAVRASTLAQEAREAENPAQMARGSGPAHARTRRWASDNRAGELLP